MAFYVTRVNKEDYFPDENKFYPNNSNLKPIYRVNMGDLLNPDMLTQLKIEFAKLWYNLVY